MRKLKDYLKEKKFQIEIDEESSTKYFSAWNKYIRIEGYSFDEGENWKFGIDPKPVFDKVNKCSVVAYLPLSNREEKRFYKFLNKITDTTDSLYREWVKEADSSFYGEFDEFGCDYEKR